jgi:Zn-dependent M28 family amino/carboxypeptidase
MGSYVYVEQAKKENENIKIAIILETIGYYVDKPFSQRYPLLLGLFYPNRANFISIVGNFSMASWVKVIAQHFKQHSRFPIATVVLFKFVPGVDFSDHWSFWQMDYPAVMVTDTAFYRYPYYHSDSDTFEKLDYQSLALVVEGLAGVLIRIL